MNLKAHFQVPSWKHLLHCICMTSWIVFFVSHAQDHHREAPDDIYVAYGVLPAIVLLIIRLLGLLAFPQTLLNFVSLFVFETFKTKVNLKTSIQSAPFFVVRVVTRGLYPNLVERNLKKNLETVFSTGCENFAIEGMQINYFFLVLVAYYILLFFSC